MQPTDVALLVVLGTADADPAPLAEIGAVARLLTPYDWRETADGLRAATERAVDEGLITVIGSDVRGEPVLKTTSRGRLEILALLRQPIPHAHGAVTRGGMSAKVCFLHHLPHPERAHRVRELAALYRDTLDALRRARRPPAPPTLDQARHEIARLESELAWLDGMMAWHPRQQAAE